MTDKEFQKLKKISAKTPFSEFAEICKHFKADKHIFVKVPSGRTLDKWEIYPHYGRTVKEILANSKLLIVEK